LFHNFSPFLKFFKLNSTHDKKYYKNVNLTSKWWRYPDVPPKKSSSFPTHPRIFNCCATMTYFNYVKHERGQITMTQFAKKTYHFQIINWTSFGFNFKLSHEVQRGHNQLTLKIFKEKYFVDGWKIKAIYFLIYS
jgi:hypothetical protein